MKVTIIIYPDHILCYVKTNKYMLEAKVTEQRIIYSVNLKVEKLPASKSASLLKRAAGEVKRLISKYNGDFKAMNLSFECLMLERKLNKGR